MLSINNRLKKKNLAVSSNKVKILKLEDINKQLIPKL